MGDRVSALRSRVRLLPPLPPADSVRLPSRRLVDVLLRHRGESPKDKNKSINHKRHKIMLIEPITKRFSGEPAAVVNRGVALAATRPPSSAAAALLLGGPLPVPSRLLLDIPGHDALLRLASSAHAARSRGQHSVPRPADEDSHPAVQPAALL